jgi:two-component sensor histidine kinase
MGEFSNQFQQAGYNADDYIQRLLSLVGDRDPLQVMGELSECAQTLVAGLDDAALRKAEAPGKWSMVEILQHLADAEMINGVRYRFILGHDTPAITGYDQDALAKQLHYRDAHPGETLELLHVLRKANLRLLSSLSKEERQRAGLHSERGRETVDRLMHLHAAHDLVHLRQLERVKAAL